MLARYDHNTFLTLVVGYIIHWNLWMHPHKVWGKLHDVAVWFEVQNELWFHFSELIASVNW